MCGLSGSCTSLQQRRRMWKEVARITASRRWQENLFWDWSGCLGKSWSANNERCEDLKRLGPAGKQAWKVMDMCWKGKETVHQGSPSVRIMLVFSWWSLLAITESRCVSFSWPAPFFLPWHCEYHSWSALAGTALIQVVLSELGSHPSLGWQQRASVVSFVSPSALRVELNECLHWPNRISQGSSRPGTLVHGEPGLTLTVLLELSIEVVPTLQWVCPGEVRSTGRRGIWGEGMGACSWQALCRADLHVFISLIYLWHWWFPWPWDFAVKGKFESLPSFIYN